MNAPTLEAVRDAIISCRLCPRLVGWREQVALEKRAAYNDWEYWGKPVPGFGDPQAKVLVMGLAPAAHGGNRTGRVFTGDRSGDALYHALHGAGYANQPISRHRDDGLQLTGAYITAAVRCAPPANKPLPDERANCLPHLQAELALLTNIQVFVTLGSVAYDTLSKVFGVRPRPAFGHGVEVPLPDGRIILCSYHPSQQNMFTGKLTQAMLDAIFIRARELVDQRRFAG
jgi:uracil-DNA glycosylase family 4